MFKSVKSARISRLKVAGVFLFLLTFLGILGSFGLTGLGRGVHSLFSRTLGRFSWVGLLISGLLAVFFWQLSNSPVRLKRFGKGVTLKSDGRLTTESNRWVKAKSVVHTKAHPANDKVESVSSIPLPATKLVSLKGFEEYFADPDLLEAEPATIMEEIYELGFDFPSYFGEGTKFAIKTPPKLYSLTGLRQYFQEVEQEVTAEVTQAKETQAVAMEILFDPLPPSGDGGLPKTGGLEPVYPGQVSQLVKMVPSTGQEKGVTISERELLLGKQKTPVPVSRTDLPPEENTTEGIFFTRQPVKELRVKSEQAEDNIETATSGTMMLLAVAEDDKPKIGPFLKKPEWELPDLALLDPVPPKNFVLDDETAGRLETVLQNFGIKARVIRTVRGPVITRHELAPAPGVKISRILNLADDIALALAARDVRIEAPIPGKAAIGIEVPNKQAEAVTFREVLETATFRDYRSKLRVALGKDIGNQPVVADLSKMPHLLIAGATGSGKSVCITALINSLLFNATPDEVKLLMVDPKMVELSQYNGIAHLLAPVVTDPKRAAVALKWIVKEMENRYELFAGAGVRDIERYNRVISGERRLPLIVVIIDELADLMLVAAGEVEEAICRLAQMARAAGIHLVIATQRPSVDVITGIIKANIPSRISFAVSSQIDSRTILDTTGAEKLLGKGDMLYSPQGVSKPLRVQGCYVSDDEVDRIIKHWQAQGRPEYLDPQRLFAEDGGNSEDVGGPDDELFSEAGKLFITTGMASVSFLQRKLKLGYARAARLMDLLEEHGIVGGYEGTKPRQILITLEEFTERFG